MVSYAPSPYETKSPYIYGTNSLYGTNNRHHPKSARPSSCLKPKRKPITDDHSHKLTKTSDTKAPTMDLSSRHIFTWGNNEYGHLGLGDAFSNKKEVLDPTKVSIDNVTWTQIACGMSHTAALSINGEVFTWGDNDFGQLGHGQKYRNVPTKVESLSGEIIVKIACGHDHTAVVTERGKVLTW